MEVDSPGELVANIIFIIIGIFFFIKLGGENNKKDGI